MIRIITVIFDRLHSWCFFCALCAWLALQSLDHHHQPLSSLIMMLKTKGHITKKFLQRCSHSKKWHELSWWSLINNLFFSSLCSSSSSVIHVQSYTYWYIAILVSFNHTREKTVITRNGGERLLIPCLYGRRIHFSRIRRRRRPWNKEA